MLRVLAPLHLGHPACSLLVLACACVCGWTARGSKKIQSFWFQTNKNLKPQPSRMPQHATTISLTYSQTYQLHLLHILIKKIKTKNQKDFKHAITNSLTFTQTHKLFTNQLHSYIIFLIMVMLHTYFNKRFNPSQCSAKSLISHICYAQTKRKKNINKSK